MEVTIDRLTPSNWAKYSDQIWRIEKASYEPARRDSLEYLLGIVRKPCSACLVALDGETVVGFCFGASLETFPHVEGTQTDPEWNMNTTFYSADITVDSNYRRKGIASKLKESQTKLASAKGYHFVAGRNRVGIAAAMIKLNAAFGAYEVQRFNNFYQDALHPKDLTYYHIDLYSQDRH